MKGDQIDQVRDEAQLKQSQLFSHLANGLIGEPTVEDITLVAIDGVDGAGKTTFADQLADHCRRISDRPVYRCSMDDFLNEKSRRYRRGRNDPEGFYRDSYNYDCAQQVLLEPLTNEIEPKVQFKAFDVDSDLLLPVKQQKIPMNSVVILDGMFLHTDLMRPYWSYSIFLSVPFEVSVPRGNSRFGLPGAVDHPKNQRYVKGQQIYLRECMPELKATWVIDNSDFNSPKIKEKEDVHTYS